MSTASSAGRASSDTGTGWNRFGPAKVTGETRSPHTGSVSTRAPSISTSTVECPSHVARNPDSARRAHCGSGLIDGSGAEGVRRCRPQRSSAIVETTVPCFKPGATGRVFRKLPST